jgi:anaerobic selenocysteine-containing dehydrogenase
MVAERPAFGEITWSSLGERAPLVTGPAPVVEGPAAAVPSAARPAAPPEGRFWLVGPPVQMRGAAVERTPSLAHQRTPWVMLNHADATALGLRDGDVAVVQTPEGEHRGPVRTSRRLVAQAVRVPNRRGAALTGTATVAKADGAA